MDPPRDRLALRAAAGGASRFSGICLGAQLLARQLGARVYSHPDTRGEAGYYPLHPTEAADRLCEAFVSRDSAINGISMGSICRPAPNCWRPARAIFRFRPTGTAERRRAAIPPGSHLPHDVPLDDARPRAPDPPRRAAARGTSARLVSARRRGFGLARRVFGELDRGRGGGGLGSQGGSSARCDGIRSLSREWRVKGAECRCSRLRRARLLRVERDFGGEPRRPIDCGKTKGTRANRVMVIRRERHGSLRSALLVLGLSLFSLSALAVAWWTHEPPYECLVRPDDGFEVCNLVQWPYDEILTVYSKKKSEGSDQ